MSHSVCVVSIDIAVQKRILGPVYPEMVTHFQDWRVLISFCKQSFNPQLLLPFMVGWKSHLNLLISHDNDDNDDNYDYEDFLRACLSQVVVE